MTKAEPILLKADNFTPLDRTPWAGQALGRTIKARLVPDVVGQAIGESWEFSLDPAFPSRLAEDESVTLAQWIAEHREEVFGKERVACGEDRCEILVKLLNPAEPLSLQVHPEDGDPDLAPGECGKPESWLVLAAEEGAGIYLGFSRALTRDELRACLKGQGAKDVLHFHPVKPGDYFEIGPGVPHAIGPGVVLLEPQRVIPGMSGKTYRLWDWGRTYDAAGRPAKDGRPRSLHIEEGLKLLRPESQVGDAFVQTLKRERVRYESRALVHDAYPANAHYQTHLVEAKTEFKGTLALEGAFGILVMLEGTARMGSKELVGGRSALLPAAAMPLAVNLEAHTRFALVTPPKARPSLA